MKTYQQLKEEVLNENPVTNMIMGKPVINTPPVDVTRQASGYNYGPNTRQGGLLGLAKSNKGLLATGAAGLASLALVGPVASVLNRSRNTTLDPEKSLVDTVGQQMRNNERRSQQSNILNRLQIGINKGRGLGLAVASNKPLSGVSVAKTRIGEA